MPPWNSVKAKVQLRISIQRLRILQQKKEAQAKATRRDISVLLERGKIETARVKVETIINEDIHVELLELLELYCELLLARFGLLDQNAREPDVGVSEGVCSIIHAAPRTELKELHVLRDILMHKYGREFSLAVMENRGGCVSDRVVKKLVMATPSSGLVDAYLAEIAKAYGVEWTPPGKNDEDDSPEGGVKEPVVDTEKKPFIAEALNVQEAVTGPTIHHPEVLPTDDDLPKARDSRPNPAHTAPAKEPTSAATEPVEDDFEMLTKRFAALKKR